VAAKAVLEDANVTWFATRSWPGVNVPTPVRGRCGPDQYSAFRLGDRLVRGRRPVVKSVEVTE